MGNYRDPNNPTWLQDVAESKKELAKEEAAIRGTVHPEWGMSRRETAGYLEAHKVTPQSVDRAAQRDLDRARHPLIGRHLFSANDEDVGRIVDVLDIMGGLFLVETWPDDSPNLVSKVVTTGPGWYALTEMDYELRLERKRFERRKRREVDLERRFPGIHGDAYWRTSASELYGRAVDRIHRDHERDSVSNVVARGGLPYIEAQIKPPTPRIRYEYDNHRGSRTGVPTAVFDGYDGWSGRTDSYGRRVR